MHKRCSRVASQHKFPKTTREKFCLSWKFFFRWVNGTGEDKSRRPQLAYSTSRWKHRRRHTKAIINVKISSGREIYCFVAGPSKLLPVLARWEKLNPTHEFAGASEAWSTTVAQWHLWSEFRVVKAKTFANNLHSKSFYLQLKISHESIKILLPDAQRTTGKSFSPEDASHSTTPLEAKKVFKVRRRFLS